MLYKCTIYIAIWSVYYREANDSVDLHYIKYPNSRIDSHLSV